MTYPHVSCEEESMERVYPAQRTAIERGDADDDAWVDHHWPSLGVRGRFPPSLRAVPSRVRARHGLILASTWEDEREFLALTRLAGSAGGAMAEAWHGAADQLTAIPGWEGTVVVGPYPVALDRVPGQQGWLRFRHRDGRELVGLLWVGWVDGDRVTVAYGGAGYREPRFAARYRDILDGLRWTAVR
jgi:hypothetical protein